MDPSAKSWERGGVPGTRDNNQSGVESWGQSWYGWLGGNLWLAQEGEKSSVPFGRENRREWGRLVLISAHRREICRLDLGTEKGSRN